MAKSPDLLDANGNPLSLGGPEPTGTPGASTGAAGAGAMPTFTAGGGSGKTFGGVPTSLFPQNITLPGQPASVGVPGLASPEMGKPQTIPAYHNGDQWTPASDPNPDNVRQIQLQMVEAGLLTMKQVHLGIWDAHSADAYAKVLAQANLQGTDATTALSNYVKAEGSLPQKSLSPEDLKGIAQQAAETFIGRQLNDVEITQFQRAFQSAVATDDPTTAAGTQQIEQDLMAKQHPQEYAATNLHQVSQHALAVLSGNNFSTPTAPR